MRRLLILLTVCVVALSAPLLWLRGRGISAVQRQPRPLEAAVAKSAWRFMIPGNVRSTKNPVLPDPSVLKQARAHWADHCATCHDNNGSGATSIGRRVYPRAPDMRASTTQLLTDGELFYAIEHGIPWTAMPGWATGRPDGEQESWALVHFIRHLPTITAEELEEMERLNPRSPATDQREREIEDFLQGPSSQSDRRR